VTLETPGLEDGWREEEKNGTWKPPKGDPLHECEFVKMGFRSWGLAAATKTADGQPEWRLNLSRLDFGDSNPSALLEVFAPNHDAAFGNLNWFVFNHSIGTNGGTNFNQAIKRLEDTLGGAKADWDRRLTYLIKMAKEANVGGGNGTFASTYRPVLMAPPEYIFDRRIRSGRTMSLFGPGSAGKTTIADGLIVSLCSGTEVVPGWIPTRKFAVLILDWDEGEEEEKVRLGAICNAYDVDLPGGYHYKRMTRALRDVADEIGAYVAQNRVEIVIVSPVGRAARNMGDNQTAPIDELYEVLRTFGTSNILIDHVTGDNMKGGAQREFGSVRKRDNARGSYAVDVQSEEPGQRVLVVRNTKADALAPRQPDQAIRVEYDPQWPHEDGSYDRIAFHADEIAAAPGYGTPNEPYTGISLREQIRDALAPEHLTIDEIVQLTGGKRPSIERVLYRYRGDWFGSLPSSNRWELLPAGRKTLPAD
jgi:hypothetical protein